MLSKFDVVKVVKVAGMVLSVAGTVATGWAGSKENKRTIEEMVVKHLENKMGES